MKDNNQANNIESQAATQSQPTVNPTANLTTEEFHKALEDNTKQMNREREHFVQRKIEARRTYDAQVKTSEHDLTELKAKKNKFNEMWRETMADFEAKERNIMKVRREARERYERTLCDLKGQHANINERISMARHNLFELYRNSGGNLWTIQPPCYTQDGADETKLK